MKKLLVTLFVIGFIITLQSCIEDEGLDLNSNEFVEAELSLDAVVETKSSGSASSSQPGICPNCKSHVIYSIGEDGNYRTYGHACPLTQCRVCQRVACTIHYDSPKREEKCSYCKYYPCICGATFGYLRKFRLPDLSNLKKAYIGSDGDLRNSSLYCLLDYMGGGGLNGINLYASEESLLPLIHKYYTVELSVPGGDWNEAIRKGYVVIGQVLNHEGRYSAGSSIYEWVAVVGYDYHNRPIMLDPACDPKKYSLGSFPSKNIYYLKHNHWQR